MVTALLEYLDPVILHLFGFLLYNFVTVTLLLFKLSKSTAMMISLSPHTVFKLFLYLVYPVAMTEIRFFLHE